MTTTPTSSTALAVPDAVFTDTERMALAGFLAGYSGLTRDAYALDLRQFLAWCKGHGLKLFSVTRSDIELYGRALEEAGRARSTVARRLCTVAGFYRYAEEEGMVAVSRAVHVRRPRIDYDSHAIGADIESLGIERGHRLMTVLRKGAKVVTVLLAPRTARGVDLAVGERSAGPIFLGSDGQRMDRHGAGRLVRRVARRAGVNKPIGPHTLRHAFITAALDAGVPLRDVQEAA